MKGRDKTNSYLAKVLIGGLMYFGLIVPAYGTTHLSLLPIV